MEAKTPLKTTGETWIGSDDEKRNDEIWSGSDGEKTWTWSDENATQKTSCAEISG